MKIETDIYAYKTILYLIYRTFDEGLITLEELVSAVIFLRLSFDQGVVL